MVWLSTHLEKNVFLKCNLAKGNSQNFLSLFKSPDMNIYAFKKKPIRQTLVLCCLDGIHHTFIHMDVRIWMAGKLLSPIWDWAEPGEALVQSHTQLYIWAFMSLHLKCSKVTHFLIKGAFSSVQMYTWRLQENFCSKVFIKPSSPRHTGKQIV